MSTRCAPAPPTSFQTIANPHGAQLHAVSWSYHLHELDTKIEELRQRLEKGKKKRINPLHKRLSARRQALQKAKKTETREYHDLVKHIQAIPSVEVNDPKFIRIRYLRYADDWIVGVCGPRHLAEQIKGELTTFLATQLRLKLSQDKTHITNARNGHASFLGTQITIGRGGEQRVVMTRNGSGHAIQRRSTGSETHMTTPMDRVIARLHRRGFCTSEGESTTKLGWIHLDPEQVIALYSGINRGIQNYYRFTDNFDKLSRIQHILRFSLARTLAAKYKVSVKRIFRRYGPNITVTVKGHDGKRDRKVSYYQNSDWAKHRNAFTTNDATIDHVQMAIRMRTRSKLGKPCCICGATNRVEMHHVRHIRKMGQRKAGGFQVIMQALNRKQIPVCKPCHQKIHRGDYNGMRLSDLIYDPR